MIILRMVNKEIFLSKHLIYITNNKATILPVTIIAMFILIIVAYACIKIFLIQNIISTTDQLQVRTGYAAEALMEQQKTRIYYQLLTQNINNDTKIVKADGKCIIEKINGTNNTNNVNFKDTNNANGKYPKESDPFGEDARMYPEISGSSTIENYEPKSWLADYGMKIYEKAGVSITANELYNNVGSITGTDNKKYLKLNKKVYGDKVEYNVDNKVDDGNCKTWFDKECTDLVAFVDITGSTIENAIPSNVYAIKERNPGQTIEQVVNSNIDALLNPKRPAGGLSQSVQICVCSLGYAVRNSSQGYVIKSEAVAKVGTKIPDVKSKVNLYFDIFMTKLYRMYSPSKIYSSSWDPVTSTWSDWAQTTVANTTPIPVFCDDTSDININRKINNIKFHIQKWEEVAN